MSKEINLVEHLTDEEYAALCAARSEHEWNALCDEVKKARGGHYPREWFTRMNLSGLMHRIFKSWEA